MTSPVNSKTMEFAIVANVMIVIHSTDAPTEAEWDAYVEALGNAGDPQRIRNLVYTEGGAPNSAQRKKVNEGILKGRPALAAVISDSGLVRGVVTALNWYNPLIKAFSPAHMDQALNHLKLVDKQKGEVVLALKRLMASLAASRGRTAAPGRQSRGG